jgi:hypothetical protein
MRPTGGRPPGPLERHRRAEADGRVDRAGRLHGLQTRSRDQNSGPRAHGSFGWQARADKPSSLDLATAGADAGCTAEQPPWVGGSQPRDARCGRMALLLSNVGVVGASQSSYSDNPSERCGGLGSRLWAVVPRPDQP